MKYLLDTHIILWAAVDVKKLSRKAKSLLENPDNILYFSPVSLWEVSIKHAIHPDNVVFTGEELSAYCREAGYLPVEIKDKHVAALETLKRAKGAPAHQDPFDRMLISQAKAENMVLLTHDSKLKHYKEKCIWTV